MKKILGIVLMLVFLHAKAYSQLILIDYGPLTADSKYAINGSHWGTNHLKYYIYNTSAHLTDTIRATAINNAFNSWAEVSNLTFERTYNETEAVIKIKWAVGDHGDGHSYLPLAGQQESMLYMLR